MKIELRDARARFPQTPEKSEQGKKGSSLPKVHHVGGTIAEENLVKLFKKQGTLFKTTHFDLNTPQRIQLPLYFNTPIRHDTTQGEGSPTRTYSPAKLNASMNSGEEKTKRNLVIPVVDGHIKFTAERRLKDHAILALACRRQGRKKVKSIIRLLIALRMKQDRIIRWQSSTITLNNTRMLFVTTAISLIFAGT